MDWQSQPNRYSILHCGLHKDIYNIAGMWISAMNPSLG